MPNDNLLSAGTKNLKVISFDLDNTLYNNHPILQKSEKLFEAFLKQEFKLQGKTFSRNAYDKIQNKLIISGNLDYENLTYLRQETLLSICCELDNTKEIVPQALAIFLKARSNILITNDIEKMLNRLSEKYILVSVTNGNCNVSKLSISPFFSRNYSPSLGFRAKPNPEMLLQIMSDYNLKNNEILLVGDSKEKDGIAAEKAQIGFYHFEPFTSNSSVATACQQLSKILL